MILTFDNLKEAKNSQILETIHKLFHEYERRGNVIPRNVWSFVDNELEQVYQLLSLRDRLELREAVLDRLEED